MTLQRNVSFQLWGHGLGKAEQWPPWHGLPRNYAKNWTSQLTGIKGPKVWRTAIDYYSSLTILYNSGTKTPPGIHHPPLHPSNCQVIVECVSTASMLVALPQSSWHLALGTGTLSPLCWHEMLSTECMDGDSWVFTSLFAAVGLRNAWTAEYKIKPMSLSLN